MDVSMWFNGINILLIAGLLFVYIKNYKAIKSGFTIGLMLFAALFLIHNIVAFYHALTMMPYYVESVKTYASAFAIMQTVAFGIMNWITWK